MADEVPAVAEAPDMDDVGELGERTDRDATDVCSWVAASAVEIADLDLVFSADFSLACIVRAIALVSEADEGSAGAALFTYFAAHCCGNSATVLFTLRGGCFECGLRALHLREMRTARKTAASGSQAD